MLAAEMLVTALASETVRSAIGAIASRLIEAKQSYQATQIDSTSLSPLERERNNILVGQLAISLR
jgi:hypothetical protein